MEDTEKLIREYMGKSEISLGRCFIIKKQDAFMTPVEFELFAADDMEYFCRITRDKNIRLVKPDNAKVEKIYRKIKKIRIPLFTDYYPMVLDGTSWSFSKNDLYLDVNVMWSRSVPVELRGLVEAADKFVNLVSFSEVIHPTGESGFMYW